VKRFALARADAEKALATRLDWVGFNLLFLVGALPSLLVVLSLLALHDAAALSLVRSSVVVRMGWWTILAGLAWFGARAQRSVALLLGARPMATVRYLSFCSIWSVPLVALACKDCLVAPARALGWLGMGAVLNALSNELVLPGRALPPASFWAGRAVLALLDWTLVAAVLAVPLLGLGLVWLAISAVLMMTMLTWSKASVLLGFSLVLIAVVWGRRPQFGAGKRVVAAAGAGLSVAISGLRPVLFSVAALLLVAFVSGGSDRAFAWLDLYLDLLLVLFVTRLALVVCTPCLVLARCYALRELPAVGN
jgi:hypothetical protein